MITHEILIAEGFIHPTKTITGTNEKYLQEKKYILPGFVPAPTVDLEEGRFSEPVLRIESFQRRLKTVEDIKYVKEKIIPVFCEPR